MNKHEDEAFLQMQRDWDAAQRERGAEAGRSLLAAMDRTGTTKGKTTVPTRAMASGCAQAIHDAGPATVHITAWQHTSEITGRAFEGFDVKVERS